MVKSLLKFAAALLALAAIAFAAVPQGSYVFRKTGTYATIAHWVDATTNVGHFVVASGGGTAEGTFTPDPETLEPVDGSTVTVTTSTGATETFKIQNGRFRHEKPNGGWENGHHNGGGGGDLDGITEAHGEDVPPPGNDESPSGDGSSGSLGDRVTQEGGETVPSLYEVIGTSEGSEAGRVESVPL